MMSWVMNPLTEDVETDVKQGENSTQSLIR